ncbi:MAG: PAS domain-containing protein [Sphingomonadales bacterium]|nr:PAS domain-containing protein [Sphingomonadales bacterium]NCQ19800.1 PAS domain-containing protein [Sphingomonadales bacterium]NCT05059.1 PAS domain-containing protein [Sphingomonadales bacterium]
MNQDAPTAHYKKMFERVSTLAKIGVWECDLKSGHLTWTNMVYDIFGIGRGTPVDRETTLQLYEPNSRWEMDRIRTEAINSGTGFALDVQIKRKDGEVRWIRLTAQVEQEAGTPVRIFGTKQDITSEKAALEQMQALQSELIHLSRASAIGAMTSTLAHELSQPLAALSNYLSTARRMAVREGISRDFNECIGGALETTHRAANIIRSVRAMTKANDSKKESIALSSLVEETLVLATAGVTDLTVSCDIDPELIVFADRIQIQQVLINLIHNACDAAAGGPCRIGIKATPKNSHVEIRVNDEGPGIPQAIIAEVFEAFTSAKSSGLGLGLSISRTIVEAHGGKISATNLPDRGASVCFTLPKSAWHG